MEFSPALAKQIRESRGLNRVAASKVVGLSRQGLVNIEDGDSIPSVATLARMADAYFTPVEDFFIDEDANGSADLRKQAETTPAATASLPKRSAVAAR